MKKKTVKKLAAEDFKKLQQHLEVQQNIKNGIADIEIAKAAGIVEFQKADENFKQFSAGLEHKYEPGIVINIADGTYKTQEEVKAEKDATDKKD